MIHVISIINIFFCPALGNVVRIFINILYFVGGAIAVIDHSDLSILGTNFTGNKAESLFDIITNPNCPQGEYVIQWSCNGINNNILTEARGPLQTSIITYLHHKT